MLWPGLLFFYHVLDTTLIRLASLWLVYPLIESETLRVEDLGRVIKLYVDIILL